MELSHIAVRRPLSSLNSDVWFLLCIFEELARCLGTISVYLYSIPYIPFHHLFLLKGSQLEQISIETCKKFDRLWGTIDRYASCP